MWQNITRKGKHQIQDCDSFLGETGQDQVTYWVLEIMLIFCLHTYILKVSV